MPEPKGDPKKLDDYAKSMSDSAKQLKSIASALSQSPAAKDWPDGDWRQLGKDAKATVLQLRKTASQLSKDARQLHKKAADLKKAMRSS